MPAVLLTAPAAEPLGLADAKAFLRLDHDDEDALVLGLIAAARAEVERLTRRVLVAQRWRLDAPVPPPGGAVILRPRPVREVEAVRFRARDGTLTALDPADWRFDWASERLEILRVTPEARVVEIDLACGYGDPEDAPESLRLALRRLVADAYERRTGADGPRADVADLIAPYRDLKL
ncbi:hypothetical protein GCM10008171_12520 [Methylopila jiangsuensis]|uniref:PhiE125 gp8 family phage protein n=1 Tax=Methylopila jiangsuensis TaxID=586230 RepID=A0A9W6JI82_9HYPH|nr:head-tail connector protein [Methylopila jiangsuensis]MDR6286237.1 putative phiE125 gp8 family phage protein [Methylopila jiangsuensis]GLK75998.1 hypothetical protein GCM10008171_12520 [Methylopila jiangsuensis]